MRNLVLSCIGILILFSLLGCFATKEALIFEHLEMLDSFDTSISNGKLLRFKSKSFLVQGYRSNKKNDLVIDSFAKNVKAQDIDTLAQFTVNIYKKSKETNAENLAKSPRVLDRYSNTHDLIFIYTWFEGKLSPRYKFKNGKMIEPENKIEISDIPESK